jgi:long-subunit fatty acid transport protein
MRGRHAAIALLFVGIAAAGTAHAGGMEFNENSAAILGRDGAFTAKGDHPMAIHYNPGALIRLDGHHAYLGFNLSDLDLTFTRSGLEEEELLAPLGPYESATVTNEAGTFVAPSLAWAYGGGRWAVAAGVYGPSAMGNRTFKEGGPQRFMLTEAETLLGYGTVSGAMMVSRKVGVGLSLQYVTMPKARFGIDVDGGIRLSPAASTIIPRHQENSFTFPNEPNPHITHTDLDVSDLAGFTAIAGLHFKLSKSFEVGVSSRLLPVDIDASGTMKLSAGPGLQDLMDNGKVAVVSAGCQGVDDACATEDGASLRFRLPPWVRLGARWIDRDEDGDENYDIEVDIVYERWSVLENYEISFDGKLKAFNRLEPLNDVIIPKNWNDTWAVRVGSTMHPVGNWLAIRAGAHFETAAVPEEMTNLDFLGFDRLGGTLGMGMLVAGVQFDLAYQIVWQPDREVTNSEVLVQRPLDPVDEQIAAGNGTYESTFHTVALSMGYAWGAEDEDEK